VVIFEQAFYSLPEYLVGTGFARYDSEGTLVMAYSMAVLQELNGRNVNNPVALISGERLYPAAGARRADLFLDFRPVGLMNPQLSAFGVRASSWLEAKFFRLCNRRPTLPRTLGVYALLRDLLRLCVLPPQDVGVLPDSSRYLLHAYEGPYRGHLAMSRNAGGRRVERRWLADLYTAGRQELGLGTLGDETAGTFNTHVGPRLRDVTASIAVTNFVLGSRGSQYQLYLSRIDGFRLGRPSGWISLNDISASESAPGYWDDFRRDLDADLQM
jgi:hypothetical protein